MIQIRSAGPADAPLVAALSRETFYETFAPVNPPKFINQFMQQQFSQEMLEAEVGVPGNYFFLLFDEGVPAGYLKLCEGREPKELKGKASMEIARLYVLGSRIGKGLGAALMQQALDVAKSKGKTCVWLGVWEKNHRAIAFYQKWGFSRFGNHVFMMGEDPQTDWLMQKEL